LSVIKRARFANTFSSDHRSAFPNSCSRASTLQETGLDVLESLVPRSQATKKMSLCCVPWKFQTVPAIIWTFLYLWIIQHRCQCLRLNRAKLSGNLAGGTLQEVPAPCSKQWIRFCFDGRRRRANISVKKVTAKIWIWSLP
jgi:hypothetical protein